MEVIKKWLRKIFEDAEHPYDISGLIFYRSGYYVRPITLQIGIGRVGIGIYEEMRKLCEEFGYETTDVLEFRPDFELDEWEFDFTDVKLFSDDDMECDCPECRGEFVCEECKTEQERRRR